MKKLTSGNYDIIAHEYENEEMPLEVEIKNDKICKIKTKKKMIPGSLEETAFTKVPNEIIKNQSLSVDAISGATHSVDGLLNAVEKVIEQAGGNAQEYKKEQKEINLNKRHVSAHFSNDFSSRHTKPEQIVKEYNTDFLIVGAGISGLAAAVQARQLDLNTIVIDKNGFVAGNGGGVEGILELTLKCKKLPVYMQKRKI